MNRVTRAVCVLLSCIWLDVAVAQTPSDRIETVTDPGNGLEIKRRNKQTGLPTFAAKRGKGLLVQTPPGASREDRAREFVRQHGTVFGLANAEAVRVTRSHADELGTEHVRFAQVHRGVPVTAGELIVHMEGERVVAANGRTLAVLPESVEPALAPGLAVDAARQVIQKRYPAELARATFSEPRLEILDRSLVSGSGVDVPRLAWFVEASGLALREYTWIDARTGALLFTFNQLPEAKDRKVYDALLGDTLPGTLRRSEGSSAFGDVDVDNAYDFSGVTYDYFFTTHGRDSYDDAGASLISTVHYCQPAVNCPNYQNAFWNGIQMVYGNNFASADDVVGHELTHAVTEYTANLFYYQQSGALNESFSDIFGETIDLGSAAGTGDDSAPVRWEMGEDLPIGAIRNMMNPNLYGDPAKMSDVNFVCRTQGWTNPSDDSGGVHSNSGVPNHAFALMVDGGTFNGKTVAAIGIAKAAKVQYRALSTYLTSGSGFNDAFDALNQSCADLIGTAGITAANCTQVRNALEAVEMDQPLSCAGAVADPPLCPAGTPANAFFDGFETTFGNWTPASTTAQGFWVWNTGVDKTGTGSAYGSDPSLTSDHTLTMASGVVVPTGGRLYFDHLFEFEHFGSTYFDGGVVLYSANGGAWTDATTLQDGGLSSSGTISPSSGNPLGGLTGFVGASYGYAGSRFDLSSLAGQNVKIRFRIGSDSSAASLGWLVDNVRIYRCLVFTDDPLASGLTVIKAVHVTQLRDRINGARTARGLAAATWGRAITPGLTVLPSDITEMRTKLAEVYTADGEAPPTYADSALPAGTLIKAAHIAELRAAVVARE